jgi:hypothetical protein
MTRLGPIPRIRHSRREVQKARAPAREDSAVTGGQTEAAPGQRRSGKMARQARSSELIMAPT